MKIKTKGPVSWPVAFLGSIAVIVQGVVVLALFALIARCSGVL